MRKSFIIVVLMLGSLTPPETSVAQSIDQCMSANTSDALQVCKSILDRGSRNADVYWKLSSALYQVGKPEQAEKTLDDALRLHPGNSKLLALKEIILAASSEKERIKKSAELNQSSLDKGALKILCLTKSGEVAISACRRRLESTDEEGERMRARLAELESEMAEVIIAIEQKPPDGGETQLPPLQRQPEPPEDASEPSNTLVIEVQRKLNEFGFNAGIPDGWIGNQTLGALSDFYNAIDAPMTPSITALTLKDFDNERRKLTFAEKLLERSKRALEQSNAALAQQELNEARLTSKLVKVPAWLEPAIRSELVKNPIDAPATGSTKAPTIISQQFSELMGRIKILHGQILRRQEEQIEQLDRLRRTF